MEIPNFTFEVKIPVCPVCLESVMVLKQQLWPPFRSESLKTSRGSCM